VVCYGKNEWYKTEAFENFNWATYCTSKAGFVSVGPDWMRAWFSDGYGDYIKHSWTDWPRLPEWAPAGEDHLLGSTNIVQKVNYQETRLRNRTFLPQSTEVFAVDRSSQTSDRPMAKPETGGSAWRRRRLAVGKTETGRNPALKHLNGRDVKIMNR
jgi:hypothetical protein